MAAHSHISHFRDNADVLRLSLAHAPSFLGGGIRGLVCLNMEAVTLQHIVGRMTMLLKGGKLSGGGLLQLIEA
jgi:hypothetical protein